MRKNLVSVGFIFALMGVFSGCGMLDQYGRQKGSADAPEGYTKISFSSPRSAQALQGFPSLLEVDPFGVDGEDSLVNANALLGGGINIYIYGVNGTDHFSSVFLNDEQFFRERFIPNGKYKVFAFGYSEQGLFGTVKCGFGENNSEIALTGGEKQIAITLKQSNCSDTQFSDSTYYDATNSKFRTLKFEICKKASGDSWPSNCTLATTVSSIRVILPAFMQFGTGMQIEIPPPAFAACLNVSNGYHSESSLFQVPAGNLSAPRSIPVMIEAFSSACPAAGTVHDFATFIGEYRFEKGLIDASNAIFVPKGSSASSSAMAKIFKSAEIQKVQLREP